MKASGEDDLRNASLIHSLREKWDRAQVQVQNRGLQVTMLFMFHITLLTSSFLINAAHFLR